MNVTKLIDSISTVDSVGGISIKRMADLKDTLASLYDTKIWDSESLYARNAKEVCFGDDSWQGMTDTHINIVPLSGKSEIAFQIRAFALLKIFSGDTEGGFGIKTGTAASYVRKMNLLGEFILKKGYDSFYQFCSEPILLIRNMVNDFYIHHIKAKEKQIDNVWFRIVFNPEKSYGLLSEATCSIFNEVGIDFQSQFHKGRTTNSHPVIPTEILKQLIEWATSVVNKAIDKIDEFEKFNALVVDALTQPRPRPRKDSIMKVAHISTLINGRLVSRFGSEQIRGEIEEFVDLKRATLIIVLAFTGMRIEEALALGIDSVSEVDGVYTAISMMTKTDETQIELPWVANKDVYDAVNVLSRVTTCARQRAKATLDHNSGRINVSCIHNLKVGLSQNRLFGLKNKITPSFNVGGDYMEFRFNHSIMNLTLTAEDIQQLERTDSNNKSYQGESRGVPYEVGDVFNLTAHMFRHTFAWFIMANRLGELDDIKYQFNHLSRAMTMVYASRGIASTEEIITILKNFEGLLTSKVAAEIAEQANDGTLGGGERFNKTAKNLVIGVTDTNSENPTEIRQIHFDSLDDFEQFLQKNLKNIRGLPHGYCTGGEACKIKNAAVPTGCVYCNSYTVTKRQMVHWAAMKKFAVGKLAMYEDLPDETQHRYELMATQWRDTVSAADTIMRNFSEAQTQTQTQESEIA